MSNTSLKDLDREIDRTIEELSTMAEVSDQASFRMGRASKKDLAQLEAAIERPLPPFFCNFYRQVGTFTLDWKWQDPEQSNHRVYGVTTLFGPREMLHHPDPEVNFANAPKYEHLLWKEGEDAEMIRRLQSFYIFDELRYDNFVLIQFPKDQKDAELYLYTRPHRLERLALDIEAYMWMTLKIRGMYLWQQYCLENGETALVLPDELPGNMTRIFPGVDLSGLSTGSRRHYPYSIRVPEGRARYAERIDASVKALQANPAIEAVQARINRINPGVHPADLHRAYLTLGFALPPVVLTFYQEINGLSLRWRSADGRGLEADCQLLSLEDLFAGFDPTGLEWVRRRRWDHDAVAVFAQPGASEELLERLTGYWLLYREERNHVLVRFEEDGDVDLLLVVDTDPYRICIGFAEFVERLIEFRGVKYWSYLFTEADPYADLGLPKDYAVKVLSLFPSIDMPERSRP